MRLVGSRLTAMSPRRASSWPATYRGRSPVSMCLRRAVGGRYEHSGRGGKARKRPADLVIAGGTIVTETAAFPASVAITEGRIVAIGEDGAMPAAGERLDAAGLHILPGAIDVHVPNPRPRFTHKGDLANGAPPRGLRGE